MSRPNTVPYVVGVDPGSKGGIACLRPGEGPPTLLFVEDLPYLAGRPDVRALREMIDTWGVLGSIFVEKAQVMPARGPDGTERATGVMGRFNYGVAYGMLLGALSALDLPLEEVASGTWKRRLNLGKDKDEARARAARAFPAMAERFSRKRDDGRAEAALIGLYGVERWAKGEGPS